MHMLSFRWNLAYADLLWEKNIIYLLKSTTEVVLKNRHMQFDPIYLLRRQIAVVERSTDQMMELYKDFIIYRWIQMVKA
jgi:hypothetical protein